MKVTIPFLLVMLCCACGAEPVVQAAVHGDKSLVRQVEAHTGFDMPAYSEVVSETIRSNGYSFSFVSPLSAMHAQSHCDLQAATMGFSPEERWGRHLTPKVGWMATYRSTTDYIVAWTVPVANGTLVEIERIND